MTPSVRSILTGGTVGLLLAAVQMDIMYAVYEEYMRCALDGLVTCILFRQHFALADRGL